MYFCSRNIIYNITTMLKENLMNIIDIVTSQLIFNSLIILRIPAWTYVIK